MRIFAVIATVLCVASCQPTEPEPHFAPNTSAIVDVSLINRATCGRLPSYSEGSWTPSDSIVAPLESALLLTLVPALADDAKMHHVRTLAPDDYYRRYAGIIQGGRRLIAICGEDRALYDERQIDWRTSTIPYRDGGAISFGAHYDPQTDEITYFEFGYVG